MGQSIKFCAISSIGVELPRPHGLRIGRRTARSQRLGFACLCFAVLYATINSIVYFVQLVVVTPLIFQGHSELAGMLAFLPRSFMLSLNALAYGLMSVSAFLAAFAFTGRARRFVRGAMWAHGAIGPVVIAAIFWPKMTYVGALWIVTFPVMALTLARDFRRFGVEGKIDDQQQLHNENQVSADAYPGSAQSRLEEQRS